MSAVKRTVEHEREVASRSVVPGVYRHFKGGRYRVLFAATDSENHTKRVVVYVSLATGEIWARPVEMFYQYVQWPDGTSRPRFEAE
jgi:cyclomaltodextrinase